MYSKKIEFEDFFGKTREATVHLNLTTHEVFKLLVEFQAIIEWTEQMQERDPDEETNTVEVIKFYNNIEDILLAAYGEPDAQGLHFRKGGVWDFKESAIFHKMMENFVSNPAGAQELVDGLMPKNMQEIIKTADANLAELAKRDDTPEALQAKINELLAAQAAGAQPDAVVSTPVTAGVTASS